MISAATISSAGVPAEYRARIHHPQTILMCRMLALEFLQTAFTNIVKARHSKEDTPTLAKYHALAADNLEEAIVWIKDLAE